MKQTGCRPRALGPRSHTVAKLADAAHFIGSELLNPGVQEVVEQLTMSLTSPQQICMTRAVSAGAYAAFAAACQRAGHIAIGVRAGGETRLNPEPGTSVAAGHHIISIGPARLEPLNVAGSPA